MPEQAKLWFDETVFLDDDNGSQANDWVLPPERHVSVGNAVKGKVTFEYFAIGPAVSTGGKIQVDMERSAALTDADAAFASFGSSTSFTRTYGTISFSFGLGGGELAGYPKGVIRVKLSNTDTGAGNWASIRLRAWVELQAS